MKREVIAINRGKKYEGAYSQAIKVGNFVFTSGFGIIDSSINLEAHTINTLENLELILNKAGTSLKNAIKMTVYIDDINNWKIFNSTYKKYFEKFNSPLPARTTVEVGHFPEGQHIEIDVIAIIFKK